MLFLKTLSIGCSELLFQTVSGSNVWMVSAELSFYMWHFNARKVTFQHFSPTSTFVTRERESKRQPNVCLPSHHRGDGDQTERGTGISFTSWKESISHPIYQFESVIAAAGLWRKDAVCTNSAEGEGCCDWKGQSAEENNLSCKQRDMPQSKKIKSHVQSGHVEGLPWNTCPPQCLAIPRSIFETRRKLTRHELLARQPHGNHAQVIHSCGPGCGIGDRHVELGRV